MGAVPGRRLLRLPGTPDISESTGASPFDVEPFRSVTGRVARTYEVASPTLVLGSTQGADRAEPDALARHGVTLHRRRSGGGAVYLAPGEQLWVDVWIPRHDPLWVDDVARAAEWVGAWWAAALRGFGLEGCAVHTGRAQPGSLGNLVCFAGRGPGEVFHGGRKVVGLSQWRAREGALFSTCAYRHWDPAPLVQLLGRGSDRGQMLRQLRRVAAGLAELAPPAGDLAAVRDCLVGSLRDFALP